MEKKVFRVQWNNETGQININGRWSTVTAVQVRHKQGIFVNFTEVDVSLIGNSTIFAFFLEGRIDGLAAYDPAAAAKISAKLLTIPASRPKHSVPPANLFAPAPDTSWAV
jgi:hypothetical protein